MQTAYPSQPDPFSFSNDTTLVCADSVGLIIRRLRSIRGLSQGDLARFSKANLSYINTIENHPSNLSIRKLLDICNGMQIGSSVVMKLLEQDIRRTADARPSYPD